MGEFRSFDTAGFEEGKPAALVEKTVRSSQGLNHHQLKRGDAMEIKGEQKYPRGSNLAPGGNDHPSIILLLPFGMFGGSFSPFFLKKNLASHPDLGLWVTVIEYFPLYPALWVWNMLGFSCP